MSQRKNIDLLASKLLTNAGSGIQQGKELLELTAKILLVVHRALQGTSIEKEANTNEQPDQC